jgi:hypothetical protein
MFYLLISLVSCRKIGDKYYIIANINFECYDEQYYYFLRILIIPLMIFWIIIFPSILFYILYRNRNELDNPVTLLKIGILYKEYKSRAYYWELIKSLEKILIIFFLNIFS